MRTDRPNILFLMTDQQRYDSLGCYGFEAAHTPHLDRLAAKGVVFDHNYVNNPICTPSRASMFTGKNLPGHGVYRLYDNLPENEVLFPKHLQELGYQTALFGKLHVSAVDYEANRRHPNDGFDVYEWCVEGCVRMDSPYQAYAKWLRENHPEFHNRLKCNLRGVRYIPRECHMTHWAAERTINHIERWDGNRPFFCMMSIFDPHNPYQDYPREMADLIDASKIPDPLIVEGEFECKPDNLRREHRNSYLGDFQQFTLDGLRKMRLGYHASIAYADLEFGRVLDALERKGIVNDTLVIFTSDHGDMLGDHQLLVKGAFFYDPNVRVPLIMRWPKRFNTGRRIGALVQSHDLAATVLEAAGMGQMDIEKVMPDSRSLISLAAGEIDCVRDEAVCCYRNSGLMYSHRYWDPPIHATMIRDKQYKLNVWHDAVGTGRHPRGELYDMVSDPRELSNLWDNPEYRDVRMGLTERLLDWSVRQELAFSSRGGESLPSQTMGKDNWRGKTLDS